MASFYFLGICLYEIHTKEFGSGYSNIDDVSLSKEQLITKCSRQEIDSVNSHILFSVTV